MKVICNKSEILAKLKVNLAQHIQMVAEAKAGYILKAKQELTEKLAALELNKAVSVSSSLKVPKDYSTIYSTTIAMLESHTGTEIELSASEYRQLVEDEWDWTRDFVGSNSHYSSSTRNYGLSKGFGTD